MYNKIIRKHYLIKLFILAIPKKKRSNFNCYFLCKYFIQNTPYSNIDGFIKEMHKISNILLNSCLNQKKVLFLCTEKFFFLDFINFKQNKFTYINKKNIFLSNKKFFDNKLAFVIMYNMSYANKIVFFFKEWKLPSIGFINFHNQPNISDYTLLLEAQFFSSIFLFHFILKKLIYNVKN